MNIDLESRDADGTPLIIIDLRREHDAAQRSLLRKTLVRSAVCLGAFLLLYSCVPHDSYAADRRVETLVTFDRSGQDTPIGGTNVYERPYSRKIGTVERLGDGSTVMREEFGRVTARSYPTPYGARIETYGSDRHK